ncbi:MAG TPA: insulinase family protein, partial [Nitrospirales bacterium]|nr:insulinase family protein [Nitrospirales bacterium]
MRQLITTIVLIAWSGGLALATLPTNEEVVFENGFTAILIENHGVPMIGSSIIVRAGSIYEDASNNGVSHMLEHLLFNGTTTRTQEALYAEQAQFGIYNNAHTSQTYTNYIVLAERDHFQT